jgi:hypothetical protein
MRWENLRSVFGGQADLSLDEIKGIEPRPLTEREAGWVRDILRANDEWRDADVSRTQVVAEEPSTEGYSWLLGHPSRKILKRSRTGVGR